MNKMILKTVSLSLLILITLLVLDYFKVITFTNMIQKALSTITVILTVFSSTCVICTSKSGFNKFLNYIILLSITAGLLMYIITNSLNTILYVALLLTVIYALMDMLYKKP